MVESGTPFCTVGRRVGSGMQLHLVGLSPIRSAGRQQISPVASIHTMRGPCSLVKEFIVYPYDRYHHHHLPGLPISTFSSISPMGPRTLSPLFNQSIYPAMQEPTDHGYYPYTRF